MAPIPKWALRRKASARQPLLAKGPIKRPRKPKQKIKRVPGTKKGMRLFKVGETLLAEQRLKSEVRFFDLNKTSNAPKLDKEIARAFFRVADASYMEKYAPCEVRDLVKGKRFSITYSSIERAYQGHLVGFEAGKSLIKIAKEKGLEVLISHVSPENRASVNLRRKLGFRKVRGADWYYLQLK